MIIDTNISCRGKIDILRAKRVDTVGRYFREETHPDWKITKAEAQELSKAQIRIFTVFEDYGQASKLKLTMEQGAKDATSAMRQAKAIGQPERSAIYFAVEGLPSGYKKKDLPRIRDYFSGVTSVVGGKYAIGVYGDGIVCKTLLEEQICKFTWLAAASHSFEGTKDFFASGQWSVAQLPPLDIKKDWGGLDIDINCPNGDFGAFAVAAN